MDRKHKQALEELAEWMEKYNVVFSYRNDTKFSVGGVDILFNNDFFEIDEEVTPDEIRYVIKEGG